MFKQTTRHCSIVIALATTIVGGILNADPALAQPTVTPNPACDRSSAPTPGQTEGPFFKPRSPERTDLREPDLKGQPIELSGFVLTRGCQPVEHALIDLWQANSGGIYDNAGFRLRGHQFTDTAGRYHFLTVMPASSKKDGHVTFMSRCKRRAAACSPRNSTFPAKRTIARIVCSVPSCSCG